MLESFDMLFALDSNPRGRMETQDARRKKNLAGVKNKLVEKAGS
jgi:hypothetical protein